MARLDVMPVTQESSAHNSTCTTLISSVSILSLWTPVKCHMNEVEKEEVESDCNVGLISKMFRGEFNHVWAVVVACFRSFPRGSDTTE